MKNEKKSKIGIATIVGQANYGNRLQNYALDSVLRNLGFDTVTFIDPLKPPCSMKKWIKQEVKRIFGLRDGYMLRRFRQFGKWDKRHLQWQDYHRASDCDYVVLGSDQIWNPNFWFIRSALDFYFGTFVEPSKRVAYAASIGADHVPTEDQADFARRLNEIKAISMREVQGAMLVNKLTGRDVPVVLDPTMLLTPEQWTEYEKAPKYKMKSNFLLTYFLGDLSAERRAYIQQIADQNHLQWIPLESEWADKPENKKYYMTTPDEFLWLVRHCQLMLTDSFHGSVFSILFNKPFRCFAREDDNLDMGSRLDTLFGSLGIGDWCRGSVQEDPDHIFYKDYASVPAVLERERQFALDYLKNALEIHE